MTRPMSDTIPACLPRLSASQFQNRCIRVNSWLLAPAIPRSLRRSATLVRRSFEELRDPSLRSSRGAAHPGSSSGRRPTMPGSRSTPRSACGRHRCGERLGPDARRPQVIDCVRRRRRPPRRRPAACRGHPGHHRRPNGRDNTGRRTAAKVSGRRVRRISAISSDRRVLGLRLGLRIGSPTLSHSTAIWSSTRSRRPPGRIDRPSAGHLGVQLVGHRHHLDSEVLHDLRAISRQVAPGAQIVPPEQRLHRRWPRFGSVVFAPWVLDGSTRIRRRRRELRW